MITAEYIKEKQTLNNLVCYGLILVHISTYVQSFKNIM